MPDGTSSLDLTVVLPAHDADATIAGQLDALVAQQWDGTWEVVVVDNRSTDRTAEIARGYAREHDRVRLVSATARASIGYSRNAGIAAARGRTIAMCDADDVVGDGWLRAIGDALRTHEFVTGPIDVHRLNPGWVVETRGTAIERGPGCFLDAFPFAHSCNLGFARGLVDRVGRFDEDLVNGSDVEFSHRVWRAGVPLFYERDAVVHYRYRTALSGLYRQARSYARVRAGLVARFRAAGTELRLGRDARYWLWLGRHLPLVRSRAGRARWVWVAGTAVGGLEGRRRARRTGARWS